MTTETKNPPTKLKAAEAPRSACVLSGRFELADGGEEGDGPVEVRLLVRTRDPVTHWYWYGEKVYHDFAGFSMHKERIVLDYEHGEEIGYCESPQTDKQGLWLAGFFTPTGEPGDPCAKVIKRGRDGVPYEASIYFAGPMKVEYLDEGKTAKVNGETVDGPCTILREWVLKAVATCAHGRDGSTRTQFSGGAEPGDDERLALSIVGPENPGDQNTPPGRDGGAMSKTNDQAPGDAPEADGQQAQQQSATDGQPEGKPGGGGDASKQSGGDAPSKQSQEPEGDAQRETFQAELKRFCDKFGDAQGAKFFAEGLTFAEALEKDYERLSEDNRKLAQKLTGADAVDDEGRGVEEPGKQSAKGLSGGGSKKSAFRFASGGGS